MKITPLSIKSFNVYKNAKSNNNYISQPIIQLAKDTISFGAKIPNDSLSIDDRIIRDKEYKRLLNNPSEIILKSLYSEDIELLQKFSTDDRFTPEEKSELLYTEARSSSYPFNWLTSIKYRMDLYRSCDTERERNANTKAIIALIKAIPDEKTAKRLLISWFDGSILLHTENPDIIKAALDAPLDKRELLLAKNESHSTPLYAANFETTKLLLEASPDEETTKEMLLTGNFHGNTPLYYADFETAKLLLAASPNKETTREMLLAQNASGYTPLHVADYDKAKLLLEASPDEETTRKMLLARDKKHDTPLHVADYDKTKLLLEASPNKETTKKMLLAQNASGYTPLHVANYDEAKLLLAASPDEETTREMLLAKDYEGHTPCYYSEYNKSRLLLEALDIVMMNTSQ